MWPKLNPLTWFLLAMIPLSNLEARAAEYFVDQRSIGGVCSDSYANVANSISKPWCTIHKSISAASAGDVVSIRSGTYQETSDKSCGVGPYADCGTLNVTKSGAVGNPITFRGYPGDAMPVIRGNGYTAFGGSLNGQSHIVVDGLEFTNAFMGLWLPVSHNIIIRNSVFHDIHGNSASNNLGAIAIFFNADGDATDILVENNTIYDTWAGDPGGVENSGGIWVYSCNNCTFRNNHIYNVEKGIFLKGQMTGENGMTENVMISGNLIHDVAQSAIQVRGNRGTESIQRNVTVFDNVIFNAGTGLAIGSTFFDEATTGVTPTYNIKFFNNTVDGGGTGVGYRQGLPANMTFVFNNIFYNSVNGSCNPDPRLGWGYYDQDFTKLIEDSNESHNPNFVENNDLIFRPGDTASSILFCWDSPKTLAQWKAYWQSRGSTNGQNNPSPQSPLFFSVGSRDYHLQNGSPAIDAGRKVDGFHCARADNDINPYPASDPSCRHWCGNAPDIGAFENCGSYVPVSPTPTPTPMPASTPTPVPTVVPEGTVPPPSTSFDTSVDPLVPSIGQSADSIEDSSAGIQTNTGCSSSGFTLAGWMTALIALLAARFARKRRIWLALLFAFLGCSSAVQPGGSSGESNPEDTTQGTAIGTPLASPIGGKNRNLTCANWQATHSDWVFCDDFEDETWQSNPDWDASPGHGPEGREAVRCDSSSFGFLDRCSAYSGVGYFDDEWGYDNHFGHASLTKEFEELYLRTYVFFSDPYVWGDTSDKGIYFESSSADDGDSTGTPNIKMEYSSYGDPDGIYVNFGKPNISSYSLPKERRFQNQGNDLEWRLGKWYLVEFHVKLNTPGQANGVARLWVDEVADPQPQTLRLEYTNLMIRNATQTHGYDRVMLTDYHQRCDLAVCPETVNQWVKWDNLVLSEAPVGP